MHRLVARRAAMLAVLTTALVGCRGHSSANAEAETVDGGGRDGASAVQGFDAEPPPDDAVPSTSPEELSPRARHLLEAIAKDDASLAADIVFPRDAWIATRDAADGGKDWAKRVLAPFRRAIHALSKRHGAGAAELVSFEIGRSMEQTTPHKRAWKEPLWTARESRITFSVDGKTRVLLIREMTAWRGAWYVTRLR
jgi:hypothetical protein